MEDGSVLGRWLGAEEQGQGYDVNLQSDTSWCWGNHTGFRWDRSNLPCGFSRLIGTGDSFRFPPFGMRMSITVFYACPTTCILGINNLFSSFTGPEVARIFLQNGPYPDSHPYAI